MRSKFAAAVAAAVTAGLGLLASAAGAQVPPSTLTGESFSSSTDVAVSAQCQPDGTPEERLGLLRRRRRPGPERPAQRPSSSSNAIVNWIAGSKSDRRTCSFGACAPQPP